MDASTEDEGRTEAQPTRYGHPVTESAGQVVVHVARGDWATVAATARADGFDMCSDLTAVDFLGAKMPRRLPDGVTAERFEVVANLRSRSEQLRLRTQVPADDPRVDSLFAVYPGSNFMEREVFDLFGIVFNGHPDLARILMPEEWNGHPLRKDYDIGAIPVQFKGDHRANA